jgi:hypothetical protein
MSGFDVGAELQAIYDSEINVTLGWMWDGGVRVRLGDEIGGFIAEETVDKVADAVPWFQEAIAHFYLTSTYARSLGGFGNPDRAELHYLDLSGGYGNAGMRPERRLSGPEWRGGMSRPKETSHSGGKAVNPRGLGTESPS